MNLYIFVMLVSLIQFYINSCDKFLTVISIYEQFCKKLRKRKVRAGKIDENSNSIELRIL